MRLLVLKVDKKEKSLLLTDGEKKFKVKVEEISKFLEGDLLELNEGKLRIRKRNVVKVDKCYKMAEELRKMGENNVIVTVIGKFREGLLVGEKHSLRVELPFIDKDRLEGKTLLLTKFLLKEMKLFPTKESRIFVKKESGKDFYF